MHRLLVADDHPLFREAISGVIAAGLEASEVLEAASLTEALRLAATHEALDLVLLDLGLPDADGLSGLARLREAAPELAVVIVSAEQQRATVLEALELGAVGYIPKSTPRETLIDALRQVLDGQVYLPPTIMRAPPAPAPSPAPLGESPLTGLTDKQREVLAHMVRGESNKMIAYRLAIAETTVKTHVSAILRKLRVSSRVQAILLASDWQRRD
ncbi:response regulator [Bisbaumannia pacifica]|uniref:Glycerol metabolism activator n=1 Tax=Bisbaumannia pacifica TaxID=77098 RepID=A0A510X824_9GAMM|nr:response regulator transcription factor [Halomonas pacifica]MBH8579436.1 response regulator transcription factor [Halomonas pacifica]GEK47592.1 glycerol metabolism activator [Halomonas pacifica]